MSPDEKRRPGGGGAPDGDDDDVNRIVRPRDRRRLAALRLPPLETGRRDPLVPPFEWRPTTFGLTCREIAAEVARCQGTGWQRWEIRQTFTDPRRQAVAA